MGDDVNRNVELEAKQRQTERKFDRFEERPEGGRVYIWDLKTLGLD